MTESTRQAFLNLLHEILNTPGTDPACPTSVDKNSSIPVGDDFLTISLLLSEAYSADIGQLIDILLHVLLSNPSFMPTSTPCLPQYRSKFLQIWGQDFTTQGDNIPAGGQEPRFMPLQGLHLLVTHRLSFQKLAHEGFGFVAELLLSCITTLSPANGGSALKWASAHGMAVGVLEELLYCVPKIGRLDGNGNAGHLVVWKCLQLLSSGAAWWEKASGDFEKSLWRLARRFFVMPTASALLLGALRIDMKPADIHSTLSLLLEKMERFHGFSVSEQLKAFTPTPFNFPVAASLERHDFSKAYEFANLRVLFVAWINGDAIHRASDEFKGPWGIDKLLQHEEAYKRLEQHPESAVRVALIYVFNEVQLQTQAEKEGFKPSTDLRVIQLLRIYFTHRLAELPKGGVSFPVSLLTATKPELRPENCIIKNAEWLMPWMWKRRRYTDNDFVMLMTSSWMLARCKEGEELIEGHPVFEVIAKHDVAIEVFTDLFKHFFIQGYVFQPETSKEVMDQAHRLLTIILEAVRLLSDKRKQGKQQLYPQIIRCFVDAVEGKWILTSHWALLCEVLTKHPRATLTEWFALAQVGDRMDMFIPVFLVDIETVTRICGGCTAASLPTDYLPKRMEHLTALLQFAVLAAKVDRDICSSLATKSHFIISLLMYVKTEYKLLLMKSSRPELVWMHAASVGAACEILVVTEFGLSSIQAGSSSNATYVGKLGERGKEVMELVASLVDFKFEMSYVISPLCGLVAMIDAGAWVGKPFTYLRVFSYIRIVLLQHEAHRWCSLISVFVVAIQALCRVDAPIRRILLENRWNLDLVVAMLNRIKSDKTCCEDCGLDFLESALKIVVLLTEKHPAWHKDLLKGRGLGRYSMLTIEILEGVFERLILSTGEVGLLTLVAKIVAVFPEWHGRAREMMRRAQNVMQPSEGDRKGLYRAYRPIPEVPFCLVPC